MKRLPIYFAAIVTLIVTQISPFAGTEIADLLPVSLVHLSYENDLVCIETDEGDFGLGISVEEALQDLEKTTAGHIFLQTADYLLVDPDSVELMKEMTAHLRPACSVCLDGGVEDFEDAASFLEGHTPQTTVRDIMAGKTVVQILKNEKGRMELVLREDG